jgi:hypothetical protein
LFCLKIPNVLLSKRPFSLSELEKFEFSVFVDHFLLFLAPDPDSELQQVRQRLFETDFSRY